MLITFEGIDGCGKSTQAARLATHLGEKGLLLREPGGTPLGEELRSLLKDPQLEIEPRAELLMFCAARAELVERVIRPAIKSGSVVICDRYIDSTVAYQGYARGLGSEVVGELNRIATAGLVPDLTLLFELSPERAARRIGTDRSVEREGGDRFEGEGASFQAAVARAYSEIADANPDRVLRIDADRSADEVEEDVRSAVEAARAASPASGPEGGGTRG